MTTINEYFSRRPIPTESAPSAASERGDVAAAHADQGAAFGNIMADISKADGPVAQGSATPLGLSRPIGTRFEEGEKDLSSAVPIRDVSDAPADAASSAGPRMSGTAAPGAARHVSTAARLAAPGVSGSGHKATSPTQPDVGAATQAGGQFFCDPAADADLAPRFGTGGRHKFHDKNDSKESAPNLSTPDPALTVSKCDLAEDIATLASVAPSAGVVRGLSAPLGPAAAPVNTPSSAASDPLAKHPFASSSGPQRESRFARSESEPTSDLDLLESMSQARGPVVKKADRPVGLLRPSSGSGTKQTIADAPQALSPNAMPIFGASRPIEAKLASRAALIGGAPEHAAAFDALPPSRDVADVGGETLRLSIRERDETKVSVIELRTHLPPVGEGAKAIEQIGNQILTEASLLSTRSAGGSERQTTPEPPADASATSAHAPQKLPSIMKSLDLRLEPESLGAVTIRLRLSGGQLEVQLEATHVQTMKLIRDDKDLLSAKLRSSGYAMDQLVVKLAEHQIGPAHTRAEAGQGQAFDGQSGNFNASSDIPQQGGGAADDRQAARRNQTTRFGKGDDTDDQARRGGDLYL